jgi:hypothetical protein
MIGRIVTQTAPLSGGELMNIDVLGLYLLRFHRPCSLNPAAGVAFDYAFRVGRQLLFGYALSRLLSPVERDVTHAF